MKSLKTLKRNSLMRSAPESFLVWNGRKDLGLRNKARKWFPKLQSTSVDYMTEMIVVLCLILIINMILLKKCLEN